MVSTHGSRRGLQIFRRSAAKKFAAPRVEKKASPIQRAGPCGTDSSLWL